MAPSAAPWQGPSAGPGVAGAEAHGCLESTPAEVLLAARRPERGGPRACARNGRCPGSAGGDAPWGPCHAAFRERTLGGRAAARRARDAAGPRWRTGGAAGPPARGGPDRAGPHAPGERVLGAPQRGPLGACRGGRARGHPGVPPARPRSGPPARPGRASDWRRGPRGARALAGAQRAARRGRGRGRASPRRGSGRCSPAGGPRAEWAPRRRGAPVRRGPATPPA